MSECLTGAVTAISVGLNGRFLSLSDDIHRRASSADSGCLIRRLTGRGRRPLFRPAANMISSSRYSACGNIRR